MVDKNVFTQELKKVFTILKEIKLVEKYVKELIDNNNLTEDRVIEFEEKLDQYKRDLDYVNENTELLQESLNQININLEDLIEYIDSIKDFINQNENTTEIGGNLEVDGDITINSIDNIVTKDDTSILKTKTFEFNFDGVIDDNKIRLNEISKNKIIEAGNFIANTQNIKSIFMFVEIPIIGKLLLPLLYLFDSQVANRNFQVISLQFIDEFNNFIIYVDLGYLEVLNPIIIEYYKNGTGKIIVNY